MESLILILIGVFNLSLVLKIKNNPEFATNYVKNSPKAFIWRKMFGEEKALKIIREIFTPIGFIMGILLIITGIFLFIK